MSTTELSAAQLAANQANAQLSTGPRTEAGKAVARFNARRHGLTGQFYCMSLEDQQAYQTFETSLLESLKPVGAYETQLAISIVQDQWRLNRSRATEFNIYGLGHDQRADLVDAPSEDTHAAATMAGTHRDDHRIFANIALYETRIHRMIAKNRKELRELQTERQAAEAKAREDAELLIQMADAASQTLEQAGVALLNDGRDLFIPFDGSAAAPQFPADGFVFSIAKLRAKLSSDRLLKQARNCAAHGWTPAILAKYGIAA